MVVLWDICICKLSRWAVIDLYNRCSPFVPVVIVVSFFVIIKSMNVKGYVFGCIHKTYNSFLKSFSKDSCKIMTILDNGFCAVLQKSVAGNIPHGNMTLSVNVRKQDYKKQCPGFHKHINDLCFRLIRAKIY
jgi:hypothetical protein